jgi:hypothetical protein
MERNAKRQRRQIVTFQDLDSGLKQRIADMLDSRQNAAILKFSSKSMMADMSDYMNCFSLPATAIYHVNDDDVDIAFRSLLDWNNIIKDIRSTQRYPCINFESNPLNLSHGYGIAGNLHVKHDPNRIYHIILTCKHANDEQTLDNIQRTINKYYNFYNLKSDEVREYEHKTIPEIIITLKTTKLTTISYDNFNNPGQSFKHVIESLVNAYIELRDSIDTLQAEDGNLRITTQPTCIVQVGQADYFDQYANVKMLLS